MTVRRVADPKWLQSTSALFDATSNHARNYFIPGGWAPAAYSRGGLELRNDVEGTAGPWGRQPVDEIVAYASVTSFAAVDHLDSLVALMTRQLPTLYGCAVVGRASIEAEAKVMWLLDPAIEVKDRVARQITLRVGALRAQAHQLQEGGASATLIEPKRQAIEAAGLRAEALGILLPPHPKLTDLVAEALRAVDFDIGVAAYGWLCDIAHARATSLLDSVLREENGAGAGGRPVPTADFFEIPAWVALMGFVGMFDRLVDYFGWDAQTWRAWKEHSMRKWLTARQEAKARFGAWSAGLSSDAAT